MVSTRSKTGALAPHPPITKRAVRKTAAPKKEDNTLPDLPDLTLMNDSADYVKVADYAAPGLILFTYPKANTGGCTVQATGLNKLHSAAKDAGYGIVGVSYDSVKSQKNWKVKHSMAIDLLSDTLDAGLLKKIGAHKAPKGVKRSVFVFEKKPEKTVAVVAKRNITPKNCVAFIEEYVKQHPLAEQKNGEKQAVADK